jgi:osmoprotectant transport system substrate-binding protein
MMRRLERIGWLMCSLLLALPLATCAPSPLQHVPIVVSSATTPEQLLLGKMTILALRAAGYNVLDRTAQGDSWVVRAALESGAVDLCWDYTGDVWFSHLHHDARITAPEALFALVRAEDALRQLSWLAMAPSQRTMALFVHKELTKADEIAKISDLAIYTQRVNRNVRLCIPEALYDETRGIRGLEQVYDLHFNRDRIRFGTVQDGYRALGQGECDCALGFASDPEIDTETMIPLSDDRGFFPVSNLAVVVRTEIADQLPTLEPALIALSQLLTSETMSALQRQITVEGQKPEAVARRFLSQHGMLKHGWTAPTATPETP